MAGAGVSWYFSSQVVIPDHSGPDHSGLPTDTTVQALLPGEVVLSRSEWSLRPGVYGLDWNAGHAIVEGVLSNDAHAVTRRLSALHGRLAPGTKVAIDASVYAGNPQQALGLALST